MSIIESIDETKRNELLNRKRPDEPLRFWVRERPAGARGIEVEQWIILYGPRGCSYGQLPFEFEHWEVAQAFANALQDYRPSGRQIADYLRS